MLRGASLGASLPYESPRLYPAILPKDEGRLRARATGGWRQVDRSCYARGEGGDGLTFLVHESVGSLVLGQVHPMND